MQTVDQQILDKASYWATGAVFDSATQNEVKQLLEKRSDKEIEDRFYRDLEFGTGGMRGIMGAGTNRMNVFNIRKASHALSLYIKETSKATHKDAQKLPRVAISFDSRNFSKEFAQSAAEVFAGNGIEVLITENLRPVPMLSFMVRHFECNAGVCVTASHNPPAYNGYKVYWSTGGQVVPPHDKSIIKNYQAISRYEDIPRVKFVDGVQSKLIRVVTKELDNPYFAKVKELSLSPEGRSGFKISYTPLHGSGLFPVTHALDMFGFKDVQVVKEQRDPNGNFPTVKYPNPEEPEALSLAIELAKKIKADLVLGTDPDADRIGIVVRENDEYVFFNGNQIGCLLTEYFLQGMKASGRMPKNPMVIKTIVTTDLQADIAQHYGSACFETLTGFKWICQYIEDVQTGKKPPVYTYVCGGEESYGFLAGSFVRDKDAVAACCIAAEMTAVYKSRGLSLTNVLDSIFTRHGVYQESLFTITLPGKDGVESIQRIMKKFRSDPPRKIAGVDVVEMIDYQARRKFKTDGITFLPFAETDVPESDVLQFVLSDQTKVSVRPSGTEPKIKFYVSVRDEAGKGKTGKDLDLIKERCKQRNQMIQDEFVAIAK